jgi:two-component system cell cycle response regulator DivK
MDIPLYHPALGIGVGSGAQTTASAGTNVVAGGIVEMRPGPREAKVLVVDDDADNRIVISRLLRLSGVSPERCCEIEGDAAEYLARSGTKYDLVFLDLQLPKKDGYTILAEIRANPEISKTKVVALTASVTHHDIERCKAAGFDGFIGKPIDGRRFSELFKRILSGEAVWTED